MNSAGFTLFGPLAEEDEQELLDLLRVNIESLTVLTRCVLPGIVQRGRGTVINLSSNAAFQPGPLMAAYYASKAYVLQLSLALAEEVRGTGVTVTALCPGPTRTGFQARGDMEDSKLVAGRRLPNARGRRVGLRAGQEGAADGRAHGPMEGRGVRHAVHPALPRSSSGDSCAGARLNRSGLVPSCRHVYGPRVAIRRHRHGEVVTC